MNEFELNRKFEQISKSWNFLIAKRTHYIK